MKKLIKDNILGLCPYQPGKPIEETKRQLKLKEVIKLASNENPLGPSPRALIAIREALLGVNRYPDSSGFYLKRAIAKKLGLKASNLILGNGSDEIIDIIIKTFLNDDECVLTADITFLEYKIITQANNGRIKTVPLKKFKYDLKCLKKTIDTRTKIVFIANPNNPTGTYVNKEEVEIFLRNLPQDLIIVFDEAYNEFIDVRDFPPTSMYLKKNNNIIILRTFSKAYGLAGLRIGYGIANPDLIGYMERARPPFNTNTLAQVAAEAALEDRQFLLKSRRVILESKRYLYGALYKLGVDYIPTVANFILMDVKQDAYFIFCEMLKYGIIVRDMKQYGLDTYIRVTIGNHEENRKFLNVLKKVL